MKNHGRENLPGPGKTGGPGGGGGAKAAVLPGGLPPVYALQDDPGAVVVPTPPTSTQALTCIPEALLLDVSTVCHDPQTGV